MIFIRLITYLFLVLVAAVGYWQESTEFVELRVETVDQLFPERKPVPGIGFVVFPRGKGPFVERIVSGKTNEKGVAVVRVPAAFMEGNEPEIVVQVAHEGMQETTSHAWKRSGWPRHGARLQVGTGKTLWFRAISPDGQPVNAMFDWRYSSGKRGRIPRTRQSDWQFGVGWLPVHLEHVEKVDVWAWSEGLGGGASFWAQASENPDQVKPIQLVGKGVVNGRVLSSTGNPVGRLSTCLRWKGYKGVLSRFQGSPSAELGVSLSVAGLRFGYGRTDVDGAFEVRGLEPGSYDILCEDRSKGRAEWIQIGSTLVTESGDPVVVRYDRTTVEVRLLTRDGRSWKGEQVGQEESDHRGGPCDYSRWPEGPQLLIREVPAGDPGHLRSWRRLPASWRSSNVFFSDVQAGKSFAVQVIGGLFQGKVHLASTVMENSNTVRISEGGKGALGKLSVVPSRDGAQYKASAWPSLHLWVADFDTGIPLLSWQRFADKEFEFTLPKGRYRVVLEGKANVDSQHGTLMRPRRFGRAEAIVEIKAGASHSVDLDLKSGGYLDISVEGESNADDLQAVCKQYPKSEPDSKWLVSYSRSVQIQIRRPLFMTEFVKFSEHSHERTSAAGIHLQTAWRFNEQHKSEMLPAGTYELVATTRGGRERVQALEIKANQTLPLVLKFPSN